MIRDKRHYRKRALRQQLLAKTPILLAKAFATGFPSSCWERTIGVLSDGKELFANRNAGPVGKASPTTTCTVGEGGAVSLAAVTFANREATTVGEVRLAKGTAALPTACFANSVGPCCWQSRWTRLLAKLGIFFPFSFAVF
jgi:hypothetical protein